MLKKIRSLTYGILVLLVVGSVWYLVDRFSFSSELPFYPVSERDDSLFVVGIIGDSWVADGVLDTLLNQEFALAGKNVSVVSSGHPGAKTKLIYQNMFKKREEERSSRYVVERKPDYCIVIAGVNDALGQVGSNFYAHHVLMIANALLHYGIKPVIVVLPEFGVLETTEEMPYLKRKRNELFAVATNHGEKDNIKSYRLALDKGVAESGLKDAILMVDFDGICVEYEKCKDLYLNASHLNRIGRGKLVKVISDAILMDSKI